MTTTHRPASLVLGWRGAWAMDVRPALVAIRDRGPLSFQDIATIVAHTALRASLTAGHDRGPAWGAEMLTRAILEDAAEIVAVDADGRYSIAADVTVHHSPFTGENLRLLTVDETAAAAAAHALERPVRRWSSDGYYRQFGGKWTGGLPRRRHDTAAVDEMAAVIDALGWQPGARIIKDQHGVTIDGFLRIEALGVLGRDPDTGVDPVTGEPYVEIRAFDNDAARLLFALNANWSSLKADSRKAVGRAVFGDDSPLTLASIAARIVPVATRMVPPVGEPVHASDPDDVDDGPEPLRSITLTEENEELLARVRYTGARGMTWKESGEDHSTASAALSRLEDGGYVVRLDGADRNGCAPYIVPDWRQGRPVVTKRKRSRRKTRNPVPAEPTTAWSNTDLAAMPFDQAYAGLSFNTAKARITIYSGVDHARPVGEHVAALVIDLGAKCPGLLDLMCDYRNGQ